MKIIEKAKYTAILVFSIMFMVSALINHSNIRREENKLSDRIELIQSENNRLAKLGQSQF